MFDELCVQYLRWSVFTAQFIWITFRILFTLIELISAKLDWA